MNTDKNRNELVKKIRDICAEQGKSISQMENDIGFSQGLTSRWIRMSPSIDKVMSVADYLGVSLDFLLGREVKTGRDSFIEKLCKAVNEKRQKWFPCGGQNPFLYPVDRLFMLQDENRECGYCEFGEGFLLLSCTLNEEEEAEHIELYVMPNYKARPTLQDYDSDDLLPLYDLVREQIVWKEDKTQAGRLVEQFMKNMLD